MILATKTHECDECGPAVSSIHEELTDLEECSCLCHLPICGQCGGSGKQPYVTPAGGVHWRNPTDCWECDGTGRERR